MCAGTLVTPFIFAIAICNREVAHVGRLLRDDHVDRAVLQHLDGGFGRIEGHNLDLAAETLVLHDLARTLRAEDVGAEDAAQIRILLQHGFHLRLRLGGIVVVVVHGHQLHIGIGLDDLLAAGLAGVGAADAGLHVLNVDRALAADGFDQRFAGDLAAEFVIGGDEGQRELDRAVDVVAVADEGIDGDDRAVRRHSPFAAGRSSLLCRPGR